MDAPFPHETTADTTLPPIEATREAPAANEVDEGDGEDAPSRESQSLPARAPVMEKLNWTCSIEDVLAAWPRDRWLAALISSGHNPRDRWSIIAQPVAAVPVLGGKTAGRRRGRRAGRKPEPRWHLHPRLVHPNDLAVGDDPDRPPFVGGWIASVRYELGHVIESKSGPKPADTDWNAVWFRCPSALVFDHQTRTWWHVQTPGAADAPTYVEPSIAQQPAPLDFRAGELSSTMGRDTYAANVRKILEHIAAGDVYQVNLTHALRGSFTGSARGLLLALLRRAKPWYGSYMEYPLDSTGTREAIVSASPEMFLSITRAGVITTRPMKGTRASRAAAGDLNSSEKERAELTMIVDLMRNDLGRICQAGTVRVEDPRSIEAHAETAHDALLQATATVTGTIARGMTFGDVLAATFPGGSVTGAPKVRAMQIIRELEGAPRGQYCGCLGFISDCGNAGFSIAIRTASIRGGVEPGVIDGFSEGATLTYGTGAGIVADSDPEAEWRETLDKAAVLLDATGHAGIRVG